MGIALCFSSTAAGAAATPALPVAPISPIVALSAFATPLSANAVRSTVKSSAASLPMTAAAVQDADTYDSGPPGIGLLGVLAGLAVFVGLTYLILGNGDDDGEINIPQEPVSPD
jgi:hypothetical protein